MCGAHMSDHLKGGAVCSRMQQDAGIMIETSVGQSSWRDIRTRLAALHFDLRNPRLFMTCATFPCRATLQDLADHVPEHSTLSDFRDIIAFIL